SFSVGAALGPLAGGVLLELFWWGSVFLLAVPVMALLLVLGPMLLPEFRDPEAGRLDLVSAGLSLAALLSVIFGLKRLAEDGAGWLPALAIAGGLALGFVFARRQRQLEDPLIDLRLFRVPAFGAALAANTLGIFVAFGIFLFIAQYLQLVLGLSPLEAGLWTVPSAGGFVVGSMAAPLLVRRASPGLVIAGGLALAAAGLALLALVEAGSGLALVVVASIVIGVGVAPAVTLGTDLIVGTAPPERAGSASGLSETGAELGGALGIAILGSIGTVVYRGELAEGVPAGVPPAEAASARDTLGGAVDAAARLPDRVGGELLDVAREAFTQGMQVAAVTSAAVALAIAAVAGVLLRRVGAPDAPPEAEAELEAA
ncbi:MAG TPA: MFS transporter, partial [Gaiellaceae bacterium]|nr:MFS transporter [Gaiellaceae bacterium]